MNSFEITSLVEHADDRTIKDFLITLLQKDEFLLQKFKIASGTQLSRSDVRSYEKQIVRICKQNENEHGFISYGASWNFHREYEEFLSETATALIDRKEYMSAFEFIRFCFMTLNSLHIDDSNGTTGALAYVCIDFWRILCDACDSSTRRMLYFQIKNILTADIADYLTTYIEEMLFKHFSEPEFLHDKLILCDEQIRSLSDGSDRAEDDKAVYSLLMNFSDRCELSNWVLYRIQLMEQLQLPQEYRDEYCKKYISLEQVRSYYAEECIRLNRFEEAIRLYEEGKELFGDLPGIMRDYSKQLAALYLKTNQMEAYKNELWHLILEYQRGDLEVYKELKVLYSEDEWAKEREKIFACVRNLDELYNYEALYDRLLEMALQAPSLYYILRYEEKVKDLAPDRILEKYETVIREIAESASNRTTYAEIAAYLIRMQSYPNGNNLVKKILDEFRIKYKRRPAMMDELNCVEV